MSWILGLTVIAVSLGAWWWFFEGPKPYMHRNVSMEDFESFLKSLLETATDQTILAIEHQGSDRFVQFTLECGIAEKTIGYGFPDAPWSREYFAPLMKEVAAQGFTYHIGETGDDVITRFLEVEMAGEHEDKIQRAAELARLTCGVMGLGSDDRFVAHYDGALDSERVFKENVTEIKRIFRERRERRKNKNS